jgi:hypothetical protein
MNKWSEQRREREQKLILEMNFPRGTLRIASWNSRFERCGNVKTISSLDLNDVAADEQEMRAREWLEIKVPCVSCDFDYS